MTIPVLTIGMAHHTDFDGVAFTIQSLRLGNDLSDIELVVVDNSATNSPYAEAIRGILGGAAGAVAGIKYVPFTEETGAANAKQHVITMAGAPHVLCMDCHVLLRPGAIDRLKVWWAEHPDSDDLLSGPLLSDSLTVMSTHFAEHWRGQMWGTWSSMWQCLCGARFATWKEDGDETTYYEDPWLHPDVEPDKPLTIVACPQCGREYPQHQWGGHDTNLLQHGYRRLGEDPNEEPFPIPAMGMGLFSTRKDTWLGFNKHVRGFGGEEMYIHHKYAQAGREVLCLPFMQWWHRFARPGNVPYPLTIDDKIRNYVLGLQELGLPLDRCRKHFVDSGAFPANRWDKLVADPVAYAPRAGSAQHQGQSAQQPAQHTGTGRPLPPPGLSLNEGFDWFKANAHYDLHELLDDLKTWGQKVAYGTITDFANRRESGLAFLAAQPKYLYIYSQEPDPLYDRLREWQAQPVNEMSITVGQPNLMELTIEPTDLLFIDPPLHTGDYLAAVLSRHEPQISRFIIVRATGIYGVNGEGPTGAGNGLLLGLKQFIAKHPAWFVLAHIEKQFGYTVLGKLPDDKPATLLQPWPVDDGPGSELKTMLRDLGLFERPNCGCNLRAQQMNQLGIEGCEQNIEMIAQWLRDGAKGWGWETGLGAMVKVAGNAVLSGVAFRLNPLDPFPGLVKEAIRRARAKAEGTAPTALEEAETHVEEA